jgi:hypothetical protein
MVMPNHAFQPPYLPPLRAAKSAAEGGRYAPHENPSWMTAR